jgi:pimeloyl-ACP methyl ester carboxylesterase
MDKKNDHSCKHSQRDSFIDTRAASHCYAFHSFPHPDDSASRHTQSRCTASVNEALSAASDNLAMPSAPLIILAASRIPADGFVPAARFCPHDWGSALGFDWANRHREAVKGIAFMEAIVAPQGRDHWDKMGMGPALEALRSEAGEAMVLQNNYFIEEILPNAILRKLSDEEMAQYRRPFAEPGEGRRPTLTWPREIPPATCERVPERE